MNAARAAVRRPAVLAAAAVLVSAIVLNLVQFPGIDAAAEPDRFDAVRRGPTADLTEIAYAECGWCRDRYSLHIALSVVAPGSRVVIPAGGPYGADRYTAEEVTVRLLTFGGAARVDRVEVPLPAPAGATVGGATVAGVDPAPYVIATGEGGSRGAPWAIAVTPERLAGAGGVPPAEFLARALAAGEHLEPSRPAGEFILLRWEQPRPGTDSGYQDLLLETALLPEPVREALPSSS